MFETTHGYFKDRIVQVDRRNALKFVLVSSGKQLTFKDGWNGDLNGFVDENDFLFGERLVRTHPDRPCCESGKLA